MSHMKNKALSLTARSVPYIKELRHIAGGVVGCILMQQLDYWFAEKEDGFYKFLCPAPDHPAYKTGDSWCEELGMTPDEFRYAFDKLGTRHASRTAYLAAVEEGDPFRGKLYLSYQNKMEGKTYYLRNHDLADAEIDRVFASKQPIAVAGEFQLQRSGRGGGSGGGKSSQVAGNVQPSDGEFPVRELENSSYGAGDVRPEYTQMNSESIPETTHRKTQITHREPAPGSEDRVVVVAPIHIDAEATSVRDAPSERENQLAQATSVRVIKNDLPEKTEVGSKIPVQVVSLTQNTPAQAETSFCRTIDLARKLTAAGITPRVATDLAERFPERIAAQLAYLPHRDARSPAGVLKTSIEGDWAAPPEFRAAEETEARVSRANTDKADLIARIKQDEESAQRRKRAFTAAWNELSLERQQEASRGAWREIAAGSGPIAARAKDVLRGGGLAGTALVAVHQTALERLVMCR